MNFYVYIIYSQSRDSYYVGYTSDLDTRLAKHNARATPSTKSGIPWVMKYHETFDNKTEAIKKELYIKKDQLNTQERSMFKSFYSLAA